MNPPFRPGETVDEIIADVMQYFGFKHQYQVAEYFGVTAQTLSGWIKSNSVPPKHLMKYRLEIQSGKNKGFPDGEVALSNKAIGHITAYPADGVKQNDESGKISLGTIYYFLAKHIKILIVLPLTISLIAGIYLFLIADPVYTSTAKILPIGQKGGSLSDLAGAAAQFGLSVPVSLGEEIPWEEIYPEIVRSEKLMEALLNQPFNTVKYGSEFTLFEIMGRNFKLQNYRVERQKKMVLEALSEIITVSKSRLSPIVTLEVEGFEPQFAAELAQAVIKESGRIQRELKSRQVSQKRKFIEDRIVEVKAALEKAELKLKNFREANRRLNKSPALKLDEDRLVREVNLQNSLYITLKSEYENAKIEEVEESAMLQVIDGPLVPYKMSSPHRFLSLFLTFFFSLALAMFIIYSHEFLFRNGASETDVTQQARRQLKQNIKSLFSFKRKVPES